MNISIARVLTAASNNWSSINSHIYIILLNNEMSSLQ